MEDFIRHGEDIAPQINGEGVDGEQMVLGSDVLIYFKLMGFEQEVLNRLRQFSHDQNLACDIDATQGFIYLGDFEAVRKELHEQVDKMFAAIAAHRGYDTETEEVNEEQTETGNS